MPSIWKQGDTWYLGYYYNGKHVQRRIGRSHDMAELARKDAELKIARGMALGTNEPVPVNCRNARREYIEYIKLHRRPTTVKRYIAILLTFQQWFEKNSTGDLQEFDKMSVEIYKQARIKYVSASTINHELTILRTWFYWLIKVEKLTINPFAKFERIPTVKREIRFFSQDEIKLILDSCTERLYPIFRTFIETGMRKGELQNLEWDDIDWQRQRILIRNKESWQPKNSLPREIPVSSELIEILRRMKRRSRWVFSTDTGKQTKHIEEAVKNLCAKLGIPHGNVHTFRHSYASHLIMSGVDLPTVQKLMGHSNIEATMIYAHLQQDHLVSASERLRERLGL